MIDPFANGKRTSAAIGSARAVCRRHASQQHREQEPFGASNSESGKTTRYAQAQTEDNLQRSIGAKVEGLEFTDAAEQVGIGEVAEHMPVQIPAVRD